MTDKPISPSYVLCCAAGVEPVSNAVATRDERCATCGVLIPDGAPCNDMFSKFSSSFNNKLDLVEGATLVCQHCAAVMTDDWMQTYASAYACAEGVFQLRSNGDLVAMLMDPPEPPFVVNVLAGGNQQHLVWRGVVNWSKDLIYVRHGDEVLTIRRELTIAALASWRRLESMCEELGIKYAPAETDAKLKKQGVGMINRTVESNARKLGLDDHLDLLQRLSAGEWWALNALRQDETGQGVKRLAVRPDGKRLILTAKQALALAEQDA